MNDSSILRAMFRGMQFLLHLLLGILLGSTYRLRYGRDWHQTAGGQKIIVWWMRQFNRIVGLRISQYGTPLTRQVLLVSNHISFLDIAVISSIVPVRFLSKTSVRYWPVIGYLTTLSGSLFIKRSKPRQMSRTLNDIRQALNRNRPVLIFPEGTTSSGEKVLKFHSGLFQAAIDCKIPVQALTLHYRHNQAADRLAAYIDNDNFLISLLRLMARLQTDVHMSFMPPVDTQGHQRRSLASYCHARIQQNLQFQLTTTNQQPRLNSVPEFVILSQCEQ